MCYVEEYIDDDLEMNEYMLEHFKKKLEGNKEEEEE